MVYTKEDKLRIIKLYMEGVNVYDDNLTKSQKNNLQKKIKVWLNLYKNFGEEGLEPKTIQFSQEQRIQAVERVLNGESRYQVAFSMGIRDKDTIKNWIAKYEKYGPDGLKDGNSAKYFKGINKAISDTSFLEQENKLLKEKVKEQEAEIAYLKKLQALIQK